MAGFDLSEIQGNIVRGYGRTFEHVRYLVVSVEDPASARAALASTVEVETDGGMPGLTRADQDPKGLPWCLNVGITYTGFAALGLPKARLATFPPEFRQGMVARAATLGDIGSSSPEHWIDGFADDRRVHLLFTIHARRPEDLTSVADRVLGVQGGRAFAPVVGETLDGALLPGDQVHFGYRDGIAGPRFEHVHPPDRDRPALSPLGVILLGHPVPSLGMTWRVPQPDALGFNGTFGAFRMLEQDVEAFEAFLATTALDAGCSPEEVAAKVCGRWRNGVSLVNAPTEALANQIANSDPAPDAKELDDFGFRREDPDGARCPIGSHIRRSNPRDAHIVQRGTNAHRTIVRRGMPYGPVYDATADPAARQAPRGLLGNFLCASLVAQFEVLQRDWVNLGLQDPRITGTNDPLVGANDGKTTDFRWTTSAGAPVVTHRLPSFVETRGGAYYFVPSIAATRWIGSGARR